MIKFVPTPIGNLQDISARSKEAFIWSDIVLCEDSRVTKKLCLLLNIDTTSKKFVAVHKYNEKDFIKNLNREFFDNNIVFCSDAGMPCVSDPGALIVDFCIKNGIDYEVIPGANAALLAFCASGVEDKEFLFYGFLPTKVSQRRDKLEDLMSGRYPTIIYEAPHRILRLLEDIESIDNSREIFIAKELTKKFETKYRGKVSDLKQLISTKSTKGEWVVLIMADNKDDVYISSKKKLLTKKDVAKLMSKISNISTKECYNFLNRDV